MMDTYVIHKILGNSAIGINKALTYLAIDDYGTYCKQWVKRHAICMFQCLIDGYTIGENYRIWINSKDEHLGKSMYISIGLEGNQRYMERFDISYNVNFKNDQILRCENHKNSLQFSHIYKEEFDNDHVQIRIKTMIYDAIYEALTSVSRKINVREMKEFTCNGNTLFFSKRKDLHEIKGVFARNGFHVDVADERYLNMSGTFRFTFKDVSALNIIYCKKVDFSRCLKNVMCDICT